MVGMSSFYHIIRIRLTKAFVRMKCVVMAFSQFQFALSSALDFALTHRTQIHSVNCRHPLLRCIRPPPFIPPDPRIDPTLDSDLWTDEKSSSMLLARASVQVSLATNLSTSHHICFSFMYVMTKVINHPHPIFETFLYGEEVDPG